MLHKSTKVSVFGAREPTPRAPTPPRRSQPLKKQSNRQGAARARQQQAYRVVDAESSGCCFTCKQWGPTDHSHLYPQGMNKLLRANPLNFLAECRTCHALWGERLSEYARLYPEALAEKVQRMQQLDRQRWAFWMMKNGHLLPAAP